MIIVNSHIKRLLVAVLFMYGTALCSQTAVVINGNIGAAIPVPFSNMPEDRSAVMKLRPCIGLQYNRDIGEKYFLKFNMLYSVKAVDFNATLVDQPYSGYMEYDIGGQVSEGYVEDAYFSGLSEGSYLMKYIELNASFARKIGAKASIYGGMYLAFLLEAKNEIYVKGTVSHGPGLPPISSEFERTEDYSDHVNSSDLGLLIGAEIKIYKNLTANARFSSGLHSIYNDDLEAMDFAMVNMYATIGFTYFINSSLYP